MPDMLVKLYELPPVEPHLEKLRALNIEIRRPIGPENYAVINWIRDNFDAGWAGEAENAFFQAPKSMFIAVRKMPHEKPEILGFACYDATVKGFFGPTGVQEEMRGHGIGKALLIRCLISMRERGYAYAIIGSAGPKDFYRKAVGAVGIEGSIPGAYRNMVGAE